MHGLYLLWWVQEKHVSPAIVAAILAAGELALIVFELPTGWFADRVGHRASLVAGSAVQIAGMLWCWLGNGVPGLVTAVVLVALGDAFRSGADEALLYRTCGGLGRTVDFQRIEARAGAAELVALVALVLAGGIIVTTWGFAAGWIAETALCSVGLVITWMMVEPPAAAESESPHHAESATWSISPALALLILPTGLLAALGSSAAFLAQTGDIRDAESLTWLVAAFTVAEAVGSMIAGRVPPVTIRGLTILCAAGVLCFAVSFVYPMSLIPVVLALALLTGLAEPMRSSAIQHLSADASRARAASLASASDTTFMLLVVPLSARLWGWR